LVVEVGATIRVVVVEFVGVTEEARSAEQTTLGLGFLDVCRFDFFGGRTKAGTGRDELCSEVGVATIVVAVVVGIGVVVVGIAVVVAGIAVVVVGIAVVVVGIAVVVVIAIVTAVVGGGAVATGTGLTSAGRVTVVVVVVIVIVVAIVTTGVVVVVVVVGIGVGCPLHHTLGETDTGVTLERGNEGGFEILFGFAVVCGAAEVDRPVDFVPEFAGEALEDVRDERDGVKRHGVGDERSNEAHQLGGDEVAVVVGVVLVLLLVSDVVDECLLRVALGGPFEEDDEGFDLGVACVHTKIAEVLLDVLDEVRVFRVVVAEDR